MQITSRVAATLSLVAIAGIAAPAAADPCGMVPPIYTGPGAPITRVGLQQTYVCCKDGIETIVLRPGFQGKVDEFGMLIPFPTPPAIRKAPDHIFPHVAAAIDPPEVVVYVARFDDRKKAKQSGGQSQPSKPDPSGLKYDSVRVLRQEAVGMYEVAVLEAGSAAALRRWMDQHGYRYPQGMDGPCNDYVKAGWCFVAVKTKVGQKRGVDPQPGQRRVESQLPTGSTFDGHVQAMGFRFRSKELVVPMRLSAFNEGKLRNVVYLLTDKPQRIRSIPEEYVVRQVTGQELIRNVTGPLPLRIIGGTAADLSSWQQRNLPARRDPTPHNGAAKDLFAADMLALKSGQLSHPHEEAEKELLRIGERFGLRGGEIDKLNMEALAEDRARIVENALADLKGMTLTVIDGDFPREVLAQKNLTFVGYHMPQRRNDPSLYDAKKHGPAPRQAGTRLDGKLGALDRRQEADQPRLGAPPALFTLAWAGPLALLALGAAGTLRRRARG